MLTFKIQGKRINGKSKCKGFEKTNKLYQGILTLKIILTWIKEIQ